MARRNWLRFRPAPTLRCSGSRRVPASTTRVTDDARRRGARRGQHERQRVHRVAGVDAGGEHRHLLRRAPACRSRGTGRALRGHGERQLLAGGDDVACRAATRADDLRLDGLQRRGRAEHGHVGPGLAHEASRGRRSTLTRSFFAQPEHGAQVLARPGRARESVGAHDLQPSVSSDQAGDALADGPEADVDDLAGAPLVVSAPPRGSRPPPRAPRPGSPWTGMGRRRRVVLAPRLERSPRRSLVGDPHQPALGALGARGRLVVDPDGGFALDHSLTSLRRLVFRQRLQALAHDVERRCRPRPRVRLSGGRKRIERGAAGQQQQARSSIERLVRLLPRSRRRAGRTRSSGPRPRALRHQPAQLVLHALAGPRSRCSPTTRALSTRRSSSMISR